MPLIKPSIPKGTRDFGPQEMIRRNYIFDTIKEVFRKYGYQEIQTPSMENLNTLTGKYGDEGDKLIFKILNSGDYLSKADEKALVAKNSNALTSSISEKALRYDLTVPFARYVVMHQNDIQLPFKRFQVQPVWRADRPQKGRYREFYQCDADVVGSESLLNEAEFVLIYDEALSRLGLKDFSIKINNRKILAGLADLSGRPELLVDLTVAIDKLDKIGLEGVEKELLEKGFTAEEINKLRPLISLSGTNEEKLAKLDSLFSASEAGLQGLSELRELFSILSAFTIQKARVEFDLTLARGLSYYTGAIFEVKTNEVSMGSIGGGGRYDDLTGMFGLKGLTGVGISFGADRIYDVLEELQLFPEASAVQTQVVLISFDEESFRYALPVLQQLRLNQISAELYPNPAKLKKQMGYADSKKVQWVILIGENERTSAELTLRNMQTGEQQQLPLPEIIRKISQG